MAKEKLFKGRYVIVFYDASDEYQIAMFDNIHQICKYKKLDYSPASYNLVKIELYRALRRPGNRTTMLNGKVMHVYLVDILEENEEF